jgi:beta-mannosidase
MPETRPREILSLDGEWSYWKDPDRVGDGQRVFDRDADRSQWRTMEIPANWYTTEVGDYHGVIWFATRFDLPSTMRDRELTLRFHSVDYLADVWLNGKYLGRHEGFFAPFEFRVSDLASPGTNLLVVKVDSPKDESEYGEIPTPQGFERPLSEPFKTRRPKALTTIKGSCIDHWHRPGWDTQFGQDGNTGGIWQGIELIATGNLRIADVKITPQLVRNDGLLDGTALVVADVEVLNPGDQTVEVQLTTEVYGKSFESEKRLSKKRTVALRPGAQRVKLVQTVQEPKLWWCWDHGKPNLYEMKVTASVAGEAQDGVTETFGIRELVLDEKGHWYLNGKRVFARGMRYHSSIWLGEADERQFREDLGRMLDLHINAIRIGSHVEQTRFYELCDEMGFLVWQVFPLHYGNYADTDDVIERAGPMMGEMVQLLYNHPSVVIWSTFKEPNVYWFESPPNLYGRLCEVLKQKAQEVDPLRWVHKGDYGEGALNVMTAGWATSPDFRQDGLDNSPQKVEFGTVHVAPLETARQILKEEEQWPPDWDRWYYLNLDPVWLQLQGIDVKELSSLEEVIERSQTWAARQIKESAEHLRQRKYAPNASMFLYFWSDPWPCLGGSGLLDYYRRKYKAYDAFEIAYQPVLVSVEWLRDELVVGHEKRYAPGEVFAAKLWVTNDTYQRYDGARLSWRLVGPEGATLQEGEARADVSEDSTQVATQTSWPVPEEAEGVHRIEVELLDEEGRELSRNWFEFRVEGQRGI